jgi:hypothetical protein
MRQRSTAAVARRQIDAPQLAKKDPCEGRIALEMPESSPLPLGSCENGAMDFDLQNAVIGGLCGVVAVTLYSTYAGRPNSKVPPEVSGTAGPSVWYSILAALVMSGIGLSLLGNWFGFSSTALVWLGLICCILGVLALLGLGPAHDVVWDKRGVWGPAGWWAMPFGRPKRYMSWGSILRFKTDLTGNHCLESDSGQTIRWTANYKNHRVLMSSVRWYRADLFRPRTPGP